MLHNSGWQTVLPDNITPCDYDLIIDNGRTGHQLFAELTRTVPLWDLYGQYKSLGQYIACERTVEIGAGRILFALCRHNVSPDKQIDTMNDILDFSLMYYLDGKARKTEILPGNMWKRFVSVLWWNNPLIVQEQNG